MKTFDDLFPAPVHTQSFLWAVGWGEVEEGLSVSDQLWEHDAISQDWDSIYRDTEYSTKKAVAASRGLIEHLLEQGDEHRVNTLRKLYHDYRLIADDEYKADHALNCRILRAVQEGLIVVSRKPSARQIEASRACYETRNLFGDTV